MKNKKYNKNRLISEESLKTIANYLFISGFITIPTFDDLDNNLELCKKIRSLRKLDSNSKVLIIIAFKLI